MIVAVSAKAPNMQAQADPRFGRCPCFVLVDTETGKFEALDNTAAAASGGAGIAAAQAVINKKAQAVVTGDLGPNAHQVLLRAGVRLFTGFSGTVAEAVEAYKNSDLAEGFGPTVDSHAGMPAPAEGHLIDSTASAGEIETLKGRANTMKQQLDNLLFRIEEFERRSSKV